MSETCNDLHQVKEQVTYFEELLLEISALLVNLPLESIDSVIEDTQQGICDSEPLSFCFVATAVYDAVHNAGMTFPFPQREVCLLTGSAAEFKHGEFGISS